MDAEDFECSICLGKVKTHFFMIIISLGMFQSPIRITYCGHMYCEKCLFYVSNDEQIWHCPDCREEHHCAVSSLTRNYHLEKLVEKFQKTRNPFGICKKHDRAVEYRE